MVSAAIERLFWRVGFGPSRADRARYRRRPIADATRALLHPGTPRLVGPEPHVVEADGSRSPLAPLARYGHDALWWLDRMVRTTAPAQERLTLAWHDHFATSNQKVGSVALMLHQNETIRRNALGSFRTLCLGMLNDRAMQWWLDLIGSYASRPNENFARELMELFTLGGGYTETDIREAARALTGYAFHYDTFTYYWNDGAHDAGRKTIFGRTGNWGPTDVVTLCLEHPAHAPFLCSKLWSYVAPGKPPASTLQRMVAAYRTSHYGIAPALEVAVTSRAFLATLDEPSMVKPPLVYCAGAMRATGTTITNDRLVWSLQAMGQVPFNPPSVAGWEQGERWLSTSTVRARLETAATLLAEHRIEQGSIPPDEPPAASLADAVAFAGSPWLARASRSALLAYARSEPDPAERRRVLRHLILAGPDAQVH